MADYLMRDGAPFGDEEWARIDETVVTLMKKALVGRRFVELVGPLGWGIEVAPLFGFTSSEGADVLVEEAQYLRLTELSQEFVLRARQLAMADQTPFSLDLGAVAIAATKLAKAEDELVIGGLAKAAGCVGELGDWDTLGDPFRAVSMATAQLLAAGYEGPYALVLNSIMYARLASLMQHGRRELDMVERLVGSGIFQSTSVPDGQALVVSPARWNFDLAVGQDIVTAYLGNQGLDHLFRVFETLVLRVKRPGAICMLS